MRIFLLVLAVCAVGCPEPVGTNDGRSEGALFEEPAMKVILRAGTQAKTSDTWR